MNETLQGFVVAGVFWLLAIVTCGGADTEKRLDRIEKAVQSANNWQHLQATCSGDGGVYTFGVYAKPAPPPEGPKTNAYGEAR